jgi:hypothetical protein
MGIPLKVNAHHLAVVKAVAVLLHPHLITLVRLNKQRLEILRRLVRRRRLIV